MTQNDFKMTPKHC